MDDYWTWFMVQDTMTSTTATHPKTRTDKAEKIAYSEKHDVDNS